MRSWLESLAGPTYVDAILWTLLALIGLVLVLGLVKLARNLNAGTFVQGGRNRKNRLAVMDATPVDSHRRLLLVRRDDVEHLILIGGPTDVVVEQNIRVAAQRRREPPRELLEPDEAAAEQLPQHARPAVTANGAIPSVEGKPNPAVAQQTEKPATTVTSRQIVEAPRAQTAMQPQNGGISHTETARPTFSAEPTSKHAQAFIPARRERPVAQPAASLPPAEPTRPAQPVMPAAPVPAAVQLPREVAPKAVNESATEEKTSLLDRATPSLDDEMTRLLGELTNRRRQ